MVKRLAEDKRFKATIEKQVLGGNGSVDVALEKDGKLIACEISVSTSPDQEFGNIQKCLAVGFETVIVISPDKKNLASIREMVEENLGTEETARLRYFNIEDFLAFLDQEEADAAGTEQIVKGYKVKVKYRRLSEAEQKAKRQAIAQTIVQATRRMKE